MFRRDNHVSRHIVHVCRFYFIRIIIKQDKYEILIRRGRDDVFFAAADTYIIVSVFVTEGGDRFFVNVAAVRADLAFETGFCTVRLRYGLPFAVAMAEFKYPDINYVNRRKIFGGFFGVGQILGESAAAGAPFFERRENYADKRGTAGKSAFADLYHVFGYRNLDKPFTAFKSVRADVFDCYRDDDERYVRAAGKRPFADRGDVAAFIYSGYDDNVRQIVFVYRAYFISSVFFRRKSEIPVVRIIRTRSEYYRRHVVIGAFALEILAQSYYIPAVYDTVAVAVGAGENIDFRFSGLRVVRIEIFTQAYQVSAVDVTVAVAVAVEYFFFVFLIIFVLYFISRAGRGAVAGKNRQRRD